MGGQALFGPNTSLDAHHDNNYRTKNCQLHRWEAVEIDSLAKTHLVTHLVIIIGTETENCELLSQIGGRKNTSLVVDNDQNRKGELSNP